MASLIATAMTSFAAEPLTWVGCGITKKAFMAELSTAYQAKYGVVVDLQGGGATKGIRQVAALKADIGGSCRPKLEREELELMASMNPVAWDALVVITHPDNPIVNISLDQLYQLYNGTLTNWKELGGQEGAIHLMTRKGKISGVGLTLRQVLYHDQEKDFPDQFQFRSSGPLEKAVQSDPLAIAVSGISSAKKRNVKILSLEGKRPDYDGIRSGEYLLYRPLYITYNLTSPRLSEVRKFIKFAHSQEGRALIRRQGVVPYLDAIHLLQKQIDEQWNLAGELADRAAQ